MSTILIKKITNKMPKDFFNVFAFDILSKAFMIIITILLIRMMPSSEYAQLVQFTALSSFICGVFGEGISLSFIRYSTEQYSRTGKSSTGLHMVSSILIVFLSFFSILLFPILSGIYNTSSTVVIFASFYGFILSLINMNQGYFQSREMYVKSGITNNLRNVFLLLFLLILLFFIGKADSQLVFIIYVVCGILAFFFGIYSIYKGVTFKQILMDLDNLKSMLHDSIGIIIYLIILNIINQIDVVMISHLMSVNDVAIYGIAFKYYSLLLTLLPSIKAVLRVRTSKKEYIDNFVQRRDFTLSWLKKTWIFVVPFSLMIIFASDIFMPILNGSQYDKSISTFKILAIGVGISYMFASNTSIMMAAKKYKTLCALAVLALGIDILLTWILIPIWGINGAAIGTITAHTFINVSVTFFILFDKGVPAR
ncbi:oligosaccharide flippase family protein [Paenibacillus tritici]|uniref:oligosaccharide flippase family protein n=1 Tax=Paenibacillus tritici TaxID=1873425 RepID=UPI001BA56671|nr:oligosaccharide flippase family protein [Paenibacillus tritici]QUL53901.1 oligosaccharide flippase family protein [Paenibacillus tritici]